MSGISQDQKKSLYLDWVEHAEGQLQNVFDNPNIWNELYSDLHWRIRVMGDQTPRPSRLIELETRRQSERLEALQAAIEVLQRWMNRSGGRCVVLDTNTLLHYLPPDQVDWFTVLGSDDEVRLIVPLRVVEELDEKKYARDARISKRARSVLSRFGDALLSRDELRYIRDGVSLEVAPSTEPRDRPLDGDWEILSSCLRLAPYTKDLLLVTGDIAMRIRSQGLGVETRLLPENYLRSKEGDD